MSDLISRQAAIEAISSMFAPTPTQKDMVEDCLEIIENLPSAQPEPKTGRWLDTYNDGDWHCSKCGAIVEKDEQIRHYWQRCYHCGARMGR